MMVRITSFAKTPRRAGRGTSNAPAPSGGSSARHCDASTSLLERSDANAMATERAVGGRVAVADAIVIPGWVQPSSGRHHVGRFWSFVVRRPRRSCRRHRQLRLRRRPIIFRPRTSKERNDLRLVGRCESAGAERGGRENATPIVLRVSSRYCGRITSWTRLQSYEHIVSVPLWQHTDGVAPSQSPASE